MIQWNFKNMKSCQWKNNGINSLIYKSLKNNKINNYTTQITVIKEEKNIIILIIIKNIKRDKLFNYYDKTNCIDLIYKKSLQYN